MVNAVSRDTVEFQDSFEESVLLDIWDLMMGTNNPNFCEIIRKNARGTHNIFRQCAAFKKYRLFVKIYEAIWSSNESLAIEISASLFPPSEDGRFPFHFCRNEDGENLIIRILNDIKNKSSTNYCLKFGLLKKVSDFITWKTQKGNNSLNIFAKKGFNLVIDWIMNFMDPDILQTLLLDTNELKNNAPMVCVIYNRNQILTRYLTWLFSTKHCTKNQIDQFLHHRNVYGQSILSLVLQHENTMSVPKALLLDQEKELL